MEFLTPAIVELIAKVGIIVIDLLFKSTAERKKRYKALYAFINSKVGELDSSNMRKNIKELKRRLDAR